MRPSEKWRPRAARVLGDAATTYNSAKEIAPPRALARFRQGNPTTPTMHPPSRRVTGPVVPHVSPPILPAFQPLRGQSFLPRHGEDRVLEQHAPRPPRHAQVADPSARVVLVVVMRTREGTHKIQTPTGQPQRRTKRRRTASESLLLTFTCTINICDSAEPSRLRRPWKVPPPADQRSNAMGTQPPLDGSPQPFSAGPCACSATRGIGTGSVCMARPCTVPSDRSRGCLGQEAAHIPGWKGLPPGRAVGF